VLISSLVIAALDAAIPLRRALLIGIAGSSPAMTEERWY
jgi:hypothetical protein